MGARRQIKGVDRAASPIPFSSFNSIGGPTRYSQLGFAGISSQF